MIKAFINSIESLGALDGPGLRTVIFFQGCGLKCKFCHNPECIQRAGGKEYILDEMVEIILKNKPYFGGYCIGETKGGVTFSGGEPLLQSDFIYELSQILKSHGIHIAIDTSLFASRKNIEKLLPVVNYWMISIKHIDENTHRQLTGTSNKLIFQNINYLDSKLTELESDIKIRIRYLIIPGISDTQKNIGQMVRFIKLIGNLDFVELLAYGTHAKNKWVEIFGKYEMDGIRNADSRDLMRIAKFLKDENIKVFY